MAVPFWYWFVLSAVLIAAEVFISGTVLLWFGIAAATTGVVRLLFPSLGWPVLAVICAMLAVASVLGYRLWLRRRPPTSDEPFLNRRMQGYVGNVYALAEPIENGYGRVRINDTWWRVEATVDLPLGQRVRVVDSNGTVLKVVAAEE